MRVVASLRMRLAGVSAVMLDRVVAVLLSVGAVANAAALEHDRIAGAVLAVICASSVAWRRSAPATATAVSLLSLAAYSALTNDPRLTFEPYAVLLNFYLVGRQRARAFAPLLAVAVAALFVAEWHSGDASAGAAFGSVLVFCVAPYAAGLLVAHHSSLVRRLRWQSLELAATSELHAQSSAAEERVAIARELHDVVAHCLSVMVIQASAARTVMRSDTKAARSSIGIIRECGDDALVELERLGGASVSAAAPGNRPDAPDDPLASRLIALTSRTSAAGTPARFISGRDLPEPPAGLAQAVFRFAQEALTNVVKHAPGSSAEVRLAVRDGALEVSVIDAGPDASAQATPLPSSGHGLAGARERVARHGGTMSSGRSPRGGWEAHASIPLPETEAPEDSGGGRGFLRGLPYDILVAAAWFVALEVEALTSAQRSGPLWLNMALVGGMAAALLWRRRRPFEFLLAVALLSIPLTTGLASRTGASLTGLFVVVLPNYTVAAWAPRRRAQLGLATWCVLATAIGAIAGAPASGLIGPVLAAACAWAAGLAVRSERLLAAELSETSARLTAERSGIARMAAAAERVRFADDVEPLAVAGITSMIAAADRAESMLERDVVVAEAALAEVERLGRETLNRVRLILGALRKPTAAPRQPVSALLASEPIGAPA